VCRPVIDRRRPTAPLSGVGPELRVVHPADPDEPGVGWEVRPGFPVAIAVQHPVGGPGHAQHPQRRVAHVSIAVGRQKDDSGHPVGVAVRVPASHRPPQRVAADVPGLDLGVIVDDRPGGPRSEDGQIQGHLRDEHGHVRVPGQGSERGEVGVGVDPPARKEDQADGRFAAGRSHHVSATQPIDRHRRVRLDAIDRRVRPVVGRVEVCHRQFEAEQGHDEDCHDDHEDPSLPVTATEAVGAACQPGSHG